MIQFTNQQVKEFRNRGDATKAVIAWLQEQTKTIREHSLIIPETGRATWQLYYYCPDCSVRLEFDIDSPKAYRCPLCGKAFSGEPYEGAWWRWLNTFNYTSTYYLSLLYLLTGEPQYAERAREVITGYARYYPDYEVHGDIPYNNPGRANSQTLDEAIFLRYFAFSYDLIEDVLDESEKALIKKDLFRIGADHLRKYRSDQLHNHEVDVDSAMAVLGILLEDEELVCHALYGKYGLYYQLENGMLEDGFWFECSSAYHSFALMNFLMFEKFALNTRWSHIDHPNYKKMLLFTCRLLKSDGTLPLLNDCMKHLGDPDAYEIYEFAYAMFREDEMLAVLQNKYKTQPRSSIEAFLYGVPELPLEPALKKTADYHNEDGSGITALHRTGDQYLVVKHGPYGGEHDHYDKLALSYTRESKPVSEDLGTTGYGAVLHYGYFKNTISHNTITLNEANQPPARGRINRFEEIDGCTWIDVEADWQHDYIGPDSFTIKQWDTEAYAGAVFRRQILFADDFLIDVEKMAGPEERRIDSSLHFGGTLAWHSRMTERAVEKIPALGAHEPYQYFTNCFVYPANEDIHAVYKLDDLVTDLYVKAFDGTVVFAEAPNNPSTTVIPYLIERTKKKTAYFAHLIATRKEGEEARISDVYFSETGNRLCVRFRLNGKEQVYHFDV